MVQKEFKKYILQDCLVTLFPNGQVIIFTFVDNVCLQGEEVCTAESRLENHKHTLLISCPKIHLSFLLTVVIPTVVTVECVFLKEVNFQSFYETRDRLQILPQCASVCSVSFQTSQQSCGLVPVMFLFCPGIIPGKDTGGLLYPPPSDFPQPRDQT